VIDDEDDFQFVVKDVTMSYTDSMISIVKSCFPHASITIMDEKIVIASAITENIEKDDHPIPDVGRRKT